MSKRNKEQQVEYCFLGNDLVPREDYFAAKLGKNASDEKEDAKEDLVNEEDYTSLKVSELKDLLDNRDIDYDSSDKKDDLITLLEIADEMN